VHRASLAVLVLTAATHEGMARLSRPGWLVLHRAGLAVLVLTGTSVAQFH